MWYGILHSSYDTSTWDTSVHCTLLRLLIAPCQQLSAYLFRHTVCMSSSVMTEFPINYDILRYYYDSIAKRKR